MIRFVPDPARGEFVNVGAIVGSEDSSEWQVQQIRNPARARAIDEHATLEAVWSFIDRLGGDIDRFDRSMESLCEAEVELDEAWLQKLHADHQNIVQLSPPTPMVADSVSDAIERVFDLMVLDPSVRKHPFQKKHVALAALRRAYRAQKIEKGHQLCERVTLRTTHHSERFDFAITNGRAVQLTQTWSFQVSQQDQLAEQVKAWGWTVQEAKNTGGQISTAEGDFDVEADVDFQAVYVPALPDHPAKAFGDAHHVFSELGIAACPYEEADKVAERARILLGR